MDPLPRPPRALPHTLTAALVWGALTVAPIVYCVVAFMVRPGGPAFSLPDVSNPFELGLTLAAVASVLGGLVLPTLIAARLRDQLGSSTSPNAMTRAAAEMQVMVVRGALFEAVCIYGFVMVFLGGPASRVVPFAAVALALLVLYFPTAERLAAPFEG